MRRKKPKNEEEGRKDRNSGLEGNEQHRGPLSDEDIQNLPGIDPSRRDFLYRVGVGALSITAIGGGLITADFLWPDVVKQPPIRFTIGTPADYPPNSVTLLPEQKVFVVRAVEGYFYAMSAICPHLGCITKWWKDLGEVRCPCHGSRFGVKGEKIAGPAPRGLYQLQMDQGRRGELIVDNDWRDKDDTVHVLKV